MKDARSEVETSKSYGNHSEDSEVDLLEQMISHEPTPEVAVQFVEEM